MKTIPFYFSFLFGLFLFTQTENVLAWTENWSSSDRVTSQDVLTDAMWNKMSDSLSEMTQTINLSGGKMAIGGYDIDPNNFITTPSLFAQKGTFGSLCFGDDCKTAWNQIVPTLPNCQTGEVLKSNGSAFLCVIDAKGGIVAGNSGEIQFNDAGNFGTDSGLFWNNTTKRLGIGTSVPEYKLDIMTDDNAFRFINGTGLYERIQGKLNSNGFFLTIMDNAGNGIPFVVSGGSTERMRIDANGNVGIGVANPTEKLEVAGQIKVSGLCMGDDCKTGWSEIVSAGGGITTETDPNVKTFAKQVLPNCTDGQVLKSNGENFSCVTDAGLTSITETDPKVETNSINYLSKWNGYALIDSEIFENAGDVGIGLNDPTEKLEVAGQIKAVGFCINNDCKTSWSDIITKAAGETGEIQFNTGENFGTNSEFIWDNLNKRLGIGTATPAGKLHLVQGSGSGTLSYSWLADRDNLIVEGEAGKPSNIEILSDTTSQIAFNTPTNRHNAGRIFYDNASGVFSITNDSAQTNINLIAGGNVGIGTATPVAKLDVAGGIKSFSILSPYVSSEENLYLRAQTGDINTGVEPYNIVMQAPRAGMMSNGNNPYGNVGIGTAEATEKLTVNGNIFLSGGWRYLNFGSLSGTGGYGIRDNGGVMEYKNSGGAWAALSSGGSGGTSQWTTGTGNISYASGNVGIGTTTPTKKLDINGDVQISTVGATYPLIINTDVSRARLYSQGSIVLQSEANANNLVVNLGKVAIGKANPTQLFDIYRNAPNDPIGMGIENIGQKYNFWVGGSATSDAGKFLLYDETHSAYRMTIAPSGNVGIGTTTPSEKLEVAGNGSFRISGGGTSLTVGSSSAVSANANVGNILFTTGYGAYSKITSYLGADSNQSDLRFSNALGESMRIHYSGNVGIGTTNPTEKLEVAGKVKATEFCMGTDCRSSWGTTSAGSSQWASATGGINYSAGNVGIGTTTPTKKLEVSDEALIDGLTVGQGAGNILGNTAVGGQALLSNTTGSSNTAFGYQALYSNLEGYQNTAIGSGALFTNTTGAYNTAIGLNSLRDNTTGIYNIGTGQGSLRFNNIGSYNTASGYQALRNNTSGNNNVGMGMYSLYSATTGSNNVGVGYNTGAGLITGSNNTIIGSNVTIATESLSNNIILADGSGNQRINVDASGKVGIGTTNPTEKLEVAGKVKATEFCMGTDCRSSWGTTSAGSSQWASATGGINYAAGNVGIGINAPTGKLDINGSDGDVLILDQDNNTLKNDWIKFTTNDKAYTYGELEATSYGIHLKLNSEWAGSRFVVTNGNVGIGTTSPQTKFEVNGNNANSLEWNAIIRNPNNTPNDLTGVGIKFKTSDYSDANESNKWSGIAGVADVGTSWNNNFGLAFYTKNGVGVNPVENLRITSTGNVGIGTTNPGAKLDVNGNIANQASALNSLDASTVRIQNANAGALNQTAKLAFDIGGIGKSVVGGYYATYNGAGDIGTGLLFGTQTNLAGGTVERMRIDQNGNVGIGTSTPTHKLHVVGAAGANNFTFNGGVPLLRLESNGSYSEPALTFAEGNYAPMAQVAGKNKGGAAGDLVLSTRKIGDANLTEKMRILDNGNVGIGTTTPNANALLDLNSSNKGMKLPTVALVSLTSPSPLSAHVAGMVVYNTTKVFPLLPGVYTNDGTRWVPSKTTGEDIFMDCTLWLTQAAAIPSGGGPVSWKMTPHVSTGSGASSGGAPVYNADGTITLKRGTYSFQYRVNTNEYTSLSQGYAPALTTVSGSAEYYNAAYISSNFYYTADRSEGNTWTDIQFFVPDTVTMKLETAYFWGSGSANGAARLRRTSL